jgi:hypothetical protein
MEERLGIHFFITEVDNTLIMSEDKNYKKNKTIYQKKENNLTSPIYYLKNNTSYTEVTVYSSLFSSEIKFEVTHKWSKTKKNIVSAKEI